MAFGISEPWRVDGRWAHSVVLRMRYGRSSPNLERSCQTSPGACLSQEQVPSGSMRLLGLKDDSHRTCGSEQLLQPNAATMAWRLRRPRTRDSGATIGADPKYDVVH